MIKPLASSSQDLLRILGDEPKVPKPGQAWKYVLAPLCPTPNRVRRKIVLPGWLYDKFFLRSLLTGVSLDEVIVTELMKTSLPDPERGDKDYWQVSRTETIHGS